MREYFHQDIVIVHGFPSKETGRQRDPMEEKRTAIVAEIPRLRRYARALMHDRDAAAIWFRIVWNARLATWRTGAPARIRIDQTRKTRRHSDMMPIDAADDTALPATQVESLASREILEALQAIAPERRAALVMVAIEGFSYAEAANVLGIPAGTLMSRISRGRAELRGLLDNAEHGRAVRMVQK